MSRMDLSHSCRGCCSMQPHASLHQAQPPAKIKNQLHGTTLMALAGYNVNLCIRKQYPHKYEDSFELRRNEFQETTFDGFGGYTINFRKKNLKKKLV
ncbi:unnamed protein product [Prunus brigantina]